MNMGQRIAIDYEMTGMKDELTLKRGVMQMHIDDYHCGDDVIVIIHHAFFDVIRLVVSRSSIMDELAILLDLEELGQLSKAPNLLSREEMLEVRTRMVQQRSHVLEERRGVDPEFFKDAGKLYEQLTDEEKLLIKSMY